MMMKALEELGMGGRFKLQSDGEIVVINGAYSVGTGVKSKTCPSTKDDLLLSYYKQIERFAKEEQEFINAIRLDYEISSAEVEALGKRMVAAKKTQTAAFEEIVKLIKKR